jgi:hypothetical protein
MFGSPAQPATHAKRAFVATQRLPDALRRLKFVEQRLRELEERLGLPPGAEERTDE